MEKTTASDRHTIMEAEQKLLSKLMNDYGPELKRIAYLYINDVAESEDIIQEVFISCYQHLASFRNEADHKTWLIRITINKCKDHRRLWSIRNLVYKPLNQIINKNASADTRHMKTEASSEVIEQLSKLSPKYREVLILYYYQELTMLEISEVLGISVNTVKSRLLRGKEAMKARLERGELHG